MHVKEGVGRPFLQHSHIIADAKKDRVWAKPFLYTGLPFTGFRGFHNSVANLFDLVANLEVGGGLFAFYDRFDEVVNFDGLQFAIADIHTGNVPGNFSVEVGGTGIDRLEAAAVVGVFCEADLQLVEALIVKIERTFGSVELNSDKVVAAPSVTGSLDASHSAALELDEEGVFIVHVNGSFLGVRT